MLKCSAMHTEAGVLYIYTFTDKPQFRSIHGERVCLKIDILENIIVLFMCSETLTVYVPESMKNFLADSPCC